MHTNSWKLTGLKLLSGLAACLVAATVHAQTPAPAGVVRISDRAATARPGHAVIQQTAVTRGQQPDSERGYLLQPAPRVVHAGPPHAMTGNPAVDLVRTVEMRQVSSSLVAGSCDTCHEGDCGSCNACDTGCSSCGKQRGGAFGKLFGRDDDGCGEEGRHCSHCARFLHKWCAYEHACKRHLLGYFMPDGCCGQGCPLFGHYRMLYSNDPYYFDGRDGGVYAAEGYGVPMAVPLAPNVRHTYNYGWGIPSSRLTPISTRAPF